MASQLLAPWHLRDPTAYETCQARLLERHPTLRLVERDEGEELLGTFAIRDQQGAVDLFKVEATLPLNFPFSLPTFRESGGRLAWSSRRHVNRDGTLCIMLPDEFWACNESCDLVSYLDGPVLDYFVSQVHFEKFGEWPYGEMRHGAEGMLQFYVELLGTKNKQALRRLCDYLVAPRIERQWLCPCGSKSKLRKCHGGKIMRLRDKVNHKGIAEVQRHLAA